MRAADERATSAEIPEHKDWVFTWGWLGRVAWFWLPAAALYGISYGAWHASSMHAWSEFPALAWRSAAACIVLVSAGRVLACLARARAPSSRAELYLVSAALLAGLVIASVALRYMHGYHAQLMAGGAMAAPQTVRDLTAFLAEAAGDAPIWAMLFLASGGYHLPAWLAERRRRRDAMRMAELARLREAKSGADLRLSILQAQIEPHFLFNTLASVRALVAAEPERAAATIDALADYLRAILPRLREDGVDTTLGSQIEICRRYLELMRLRLGGRLSFAIAVSPQARDAAFPPLLLLPLLENAVKHGIEPKAGPGHIALRAERRGDRLVVAVEDDGRGLQAKTGAGLGLANIREQLRDRFGDAASLEVRGTPAGVCATLAVPAA